MVDFAELHKQRQTNWRQLPDNHIANGEEAAGLIEQFGIATLYPASPEIPSLYQAYQGDRAVSMLESWDSPVGDVYSWRWTIGKAEKAFYTALVRNRPTWISWQLLPALLRLKAEMTPVEELYEKGKLSAGAYRIYQTLAASSTGVLSTKVLRREAGFPYSKEQRSAYLKAVEELDTRLILAKVFPSAEGDDNMHHALVAIRFADYLATAQKMSQLEALQAFLTAYVTHAVYTLPTVLAKHLKLAEPELRSALETLVQSGTVQAVTFPEHKGKCYIKLCQN